MKLIIIVLTLLLIGSLTNAAPRTSICRKQVDVFGYSYEKTICFVNFGASHYNARQFCKNNGMALYDLASSDAARSQLLEVAQVVLGYSSRARVWTSRRRGNSCQHVSGTGRIANSGCGTSNPFICEFIHPTPKNTFPAPGVCGINAENRIVGGVQPTLKEFPWLVLLTIRSEKKPGEEFNCGGSLIHPQFILTAAHCFFTRRDEVDIALGEFDITTDPDCIDNVCNDAVVTKLPSEIIMHRLYNDGTKYNDIALLMLQEPISYTLNIKPICLPVNVTFWNTEYDGQTLVAAGWGNTLEGGDSSDVLLKVNLTGISNDECKTTYDDLISSQLCAGGVEGKDTCQGDSGGPLMFKAITQTNPPYWYAAGVVSYGEGCGNAGVPGVYTRVANFIDWIRANIETRI